MQIPSSFKIKTKPQPLLAQDQMDQNSPTDLSTSFRFKVNNSGIENSDCSLNRAIY